MMLIYGMEQIWQVHANDISETDFANENIGCDTLVMCARWSILGGNFWRS